MKITIHHSPATLFKKRLGVLLKTSLLLPALGLSFVAKTAPLADSLQVTLTEGTNMAIALSPDKKTLALDLQGTIWRLPVAGGTAIALTDALGDSRQPAFSPDGSRIAFQSFRDGTYHIWTVNTDGSGLRQLTFGMYDEREPHFSPDGSSLIFSSDRSGNYDIWQLELTSGQLKQLTQDPANDYYPAYSPDGKRIAFVSERTAAPGIYALNADSKEQLMMQQEGKLAAPTWHPNGTQVLFNTIFQGQSLLEMINMGDGDGLALTDPGEDVFPFRVSWLSPTEFLYTSDGKIKRRKIGKKGAKAIPFKASVSLSRTPYERKKYDFDTTAPQQVKGIRSPAVSPDGSSIVFTALGDLWVLKKGQKKPVALTNDALIEIDPAWSPDGKQLAYLSDKNGNMDLWVRDLASGKERLVVDGTETLKFPTWSPDGTKISFYQASPTGFNSRSISTVEVASGKVTPVYDSFFDGGRTSWSPDGKTLVFSALNPNSTRYREGVSEFMLVSLEDKSAQFVAPVPGRTPATRGINGPVWSPDGSMMAYVMEGVLWTVPVDPSGKIAGPPKRLTNELAESPTWTGDSKSLVYLATDKLKQVYLTDGHVEEIPMDFTWQHQKAEGQVVIHAGKMFDGRTASYRTNVDIIVEGNRIKEIVPHQAGRQGKLIDASTKTVIPGLVEMHTHLDATAGEKLGRMWLSYGITTIREPGTDAYDVIERKESWASGRRIGPRTFYTGGILDGSRIYYGMNVGNQPGAQLDLELDRVKRLDYDFIKTYVRMPDPMQERVTAYAHSIGIPVSSHEIYPAMKYGVDNVEHMGATSRRGYSPKLTALNKSYQDVITLIAKSGMIITPTASLHGGYFTLAHKDPTFFAHPQFKAFYSEKTMEDVKAVAARRSEYLVGYQNVQHSLKELMKAGARVTPGTDSPIIHPGISYHAELQTWVEAGISPFETLRAATLWSAEALGVSKDLGTLEAGKLADLVIVEGDPLKNIKDVLHVETVFKNGNQYSLEDLLKPSQP